MISDKGNKIKSVKLNIWLSDDNSGIVEVAFHASCRPSRTKKEDWLVKFRNLSELIEGIKELRALVRAQERAVEERAYCELCNTVTTIERCYPTRTPRLCYCAWCGASGSSLTWIR